MSCMLRWLMQQAGRTQCRSDAGLQAAANCTQPWLQPEPKVLLPTHHTHQSPSPPPPSPAACRRPQLWPSPAAHFITSHICPCHLPPPGPGHPCTNAAADQHPAIRSSSQQLPDTCAFCP